MTLTAVATVMIVGSGCTADRDTAPHGPAPSRPAAVPAAPSPGRPAADTGVPGDLVTEAESTGDAPGVLSTIEVERRSDTDRVVFAFAGQVPGYRISYVPLSDVRGDGGPVALAGAMVLVVELTQASAASYTGPDRIPAMASENEAAVVEELVRTADTGALLVWAIGVRERVPFVVTSSTGPGPAQLTVDLSHED